MAEIEQPTTDPATGVELIPTDHVLCPTCLGAKGLAVGAVERTFLCGTDFLPGDQMALSPTAQNPCVVCFSGFLQCSGCGGWATVVAL